MRHFTVSGPCPTAAQRAARRIYSKHAARGRHTVMIGISEHDNSLPERRLSACDVFITVHQGETLTVSELP